eukprot:g3197.t1
MCSLCKDDFYLAQGACVNGHCGYNCFAITNCESKGLLTEKIGTKTSDAVCVDLETAMNNMKAFAAELHSSANEILREERKAAKVANKELEIAKAIVAKQQKGVNDAKKNLESAKKNISISLAKLKEAKEDEIAALSDVEKEIARRNVQESNAALHQATENEQEAISNLNQAKNGLKEASRLLEDKKLAALEATTAVKLAETVVAKRDSEKNFVPVDVFHVEVFGQINYKGNDGRFRHLQEKNLLPGSCGSQSEDIWNKSIEKQMEMKADIIDWEWDGCKDFVYSFKVVVEVESENDVVQEENLSSNLTKDLLSIAPTATVQVDKVGNYVHKIVMKPSSNSDLHMSNAAKGMWRRKTGLIGVIITSVIIVCTILFCICQKVRSIPKAGKDNPINELNFFENQSKSQSRSIIFGGDVSHLSQKVQSRNDTFSFFSNFFRRRNSFDDANTQKVKTLNLLHGKNSLDTSHMSLPEQGDNVINVDFLEPSSSSLKTSVDKKNRIIELAHSNLKEPVRLPEEVVVVETQCTVQPENESRRDETQIEKETNTTRFSLDPRKYVKNSFVVGKAFEVDDVETKADTADMKKLFQSADSDQSGYLDENEMKTLYKKLNTVSKANKNVVGKKEKDKGSKEVENMLSSHDSEEHITKDTTERGGLMKGRGLPRFGQRSRGRGRRRRGRVYNSSERNSRHYNSSASDLSDENIHE